MQNKALEPGHITNILNIHIQKYIQTAFTHLNNI